MISTLGDKKSLNITSSIAKTAKTELEKILYNRKDPFLKLNIDVNLGTIPQLNNLNFTYVCNLLCR